MSNSVSANTANLYDPVTGAVIGYIDLFGNERYYGGAGGVAGVDGNGQLVDGNGNVLPAGRASGAATAVQGLGIWLPFTANGTKSRLVDRAANIVFANSAVSGGVKIATQAAVAIAITTGIVTETGHGRRNGDPVLLSIITGAAGLSSGTIYFVSGATATTYGLAATPHGTAITTTTAGTATVYGMGRSALPGAQFNGADYLQSDITQQGALQKSIMRLDTLREDGADCIFIYMELTHGLGQPGGTDGNLIAFGRRTSTSAGCGWGISVAAAPAQVKLQFEHCPKASSVNGIVQPINGSLTMQGDGFGGSAGTGINTRSCLAIAISKLPITGTGDQGNSGSGAGCFYIEASRRGLTDDGYFGQRNFATATPFRLPAPSAGTATAVADGSANVGITIGMFPGGSASTVAKPMIAGTGIDNLIIQRRKRVGAQVITAVHQGYLNYQANPFALPMQPKVLASFQ